MRKQAKQCSIQRNRGYSAFERHQCAETEHGMAEGTCIGNPSNMHVQITMQLHDMILFDTVLCDNIIAP